MKGRVTLTVVLSSAILSAAPAAAQARALITDAPPAETESTSATFRFESSPRPPLGSPTFECQIDGATWQRCASPVELIGLGGGTHSFAVRATGLLVDRTPDRRSWKVLQQTIVAPDPVPPPRPPRPPQDDHPRHAAAGCEYGAATERDAGPAKLRSATICLFNGIRHRDGLRPASADQDLTRLAQTYATEIVEKRFFSHTTPDGRTFKQRARDSSYVRGRPAWEVGEILAWAGGRHVTPHSMVRAWMRSPPHRAVILGAAFRDVGVGIQFRTPRAGIQHGATYVAEFGHVG